MAVTGAGHGGGHGGCDRHRDHCHRKHGLVPMRIPLREMRASGLRPLPCSAASGAPSPFVAMCEKACNVRRRGALPAAFPPLFKGGARVAAAPPQIMQPLGPPPSPCSSSPASARACGCRAREVAERLLRGSSRARLLSPSGCTFFAHFYPGNELFLRAGSGIFSDDQDFEVRGHAPQQDPPKISPTIFHQTETF
jgi:hypothetical protein